MIEPLHSFYEYDKATDMVTLLLRKKDMRGLSENEEKELTELIARCEDYEKKRGDA